MLEGVKDAFRHWWLATRCAIIESKTEACRQSIRKTKYGAARLFLNCSGNGLEEYEIWDQSNVRSAPNTGHSHQIRWTTGFDPKPTCLIST